MRYLVLDPERIVTYQEGERLAGGDIPLTLFAWPHNGLDAALGVLPEEAQITVAPGPETRGDQEMEPYRLYVRFDAQPIAEELSDPLARFANGLTLQDAQIVWVDNSPSVMLSWRLQEPLSELVQVFVHFVDADGNIVDQFDEPPGTVYYPPLAWEQGSVIIQRARSGLHFLPGDELTVRIGLYNPQNGERLDILESRVEQQDNALILRVHGE